MKLYAISDLHLASRVNREALAATSAYPDDWLIVAGDLGESADHLRFALDVLTSRFRRLIWVPGNHELWTSESDDGHLRGEAKYRRLVEICRRRGVLTPEDPWARWPGTPEDQPGFIVAPLFVLYDYSFRPAAVALDDAVAWAAASGVMCSDEILLKPAPHASIPEWSAERVRITEARLEQAAVTGDRLILVNHWPLREDLVHLRRIPRFKIWCGTKATEDWHQRFGAAVVIHGHLHVKGTHFRDGVRFEEVSLGYPRDWQRERGVDGYLRQILPLPETWLAGQQGTGAGSGSASIEPTSSSGGVVSNVA